MTRWTLRARPAVLGLGATTVWLALVAARPPVPANAGLAVVLLAGAVSLAAHPLRGGPDVRSAMVAGVVAAVSQVLAVALLMPRVPERWVPPVVTVAATPADNVLQSRIETVDPYVLVGFLGVMMLLVLAIQAAVALAPRWSAAAARRLRALRTP